MSDEPSLNQSHSVRPEESEEAKESTASKSRISKNKKEDPEIKKIARRILEDDNYEGVTSKNLYFVKKELIRIQDSFQDKQEYDKAEYVEERIERVRKLITEDKFGEIQAERAANYNNILDDTKSKSSTTNQQWNDLVENVKSQKEEDIKQLLAEFDEELKEFDKQYEQDPPPQFTKFSQKLSLMKNEVKALVLAGQFLDAKQVKANVNKLEAQEVKKQKANWIAHLDKKRNELVQKQQKTLDKRILSWDSSISKIKHAHGVDKKHFKRSEDYLSMKVDESSPKSSPISLSNTNGSKKIVKPLSDKEWILQRKKAAYITYTKRPSPRK